MDYGLAALTPAEVAVYLVILRETRADGMARVARSDIARRASVDPRTVSRALGALTDRGAILRLKPGAGSRMAVYSPFNAETLRERYTKAARWLPAQGEGTPVSPIRSTDG